MQVTKAEAALVARCAADFWFFAALLKIVDKQGNLVPLVPHAGQEEILGILSSCLWAFFLKARRIGSTTIIAAWVLWQVMFRPHLKAAVIAHVDENEVWAIYQTFYDNLPPALKRLFPLQQDSVRVMRFRHGGRIVVASARSDKLVGGGFQIVHATELARYPDVHDVIRKVFSAADGAASIVIETTPKGVNEAYHFWHGTGSFAQAKMFTRHFVSWLKDPTAVVHAGDPDYIPPFDDPGLAALEAQYARQFGFTVEQQNFFRTQLMKLGGSIDSFNENFPLTPEQGFLLSGRPFFRRRFEEALGHECREGLTELEPPAPWHRYLAGIDMAGGTPDGDWSATVVVDASDKDHHRVVATLYRRSDVVPYCEEALALCRRYGAFATIERNNHGIVAVQLFKRAGYPYLYRTIQQGRIGDESNETIGYSTSPGSRESMLFRLQTLVNLGKLDLGDLRLKAEANAFVFRQDGTPGATGGAHDDGMLATALAEAGDEQAGEVHAVDAAYQHRPRNAAEVVAWEVSQGRLYDSTEGYGDDRDRPLRGFTGLSRIH